MMLEQGAIISDCTKQKVNARSSMESEMIAVDDTLSNIPWTKGLLKLRDIKSMRMWSIKTIQVP